MGLDIAEGKYNRCEDIAIEYVNAIILESTAFWSEINFVCL